jgi:hypothetical protein
MRKKIQELNKKVEPYYLLITMLLFLVTAPITLYTIIPPPRHIVVKVDKENINYPASINDKYIKIYNYVNDSTNNEDLKNNSNELFDYLIKTKDQWNIDIKNNSKKTIKGIHLRLLNVSSLTSSAVTSSYLLEEEKNNMVKNLIFDKVSGIIYLKDAVDLPPFGELKISLWGEFYNWMNTLNVNYEDGEAKIEYIKTFSGLKAVIGQFSTTIFITLIATFILIYYLQLKKYGIHKKNISKHN